MFLAKKEKNVSQDATDNLSLKILKYVTITFVSLFREKITLLQ